MFKHYVLTLDGTSQLVSEVTGAEGDLLKSITFQHGVANVAVIYIGNGTITTSDYGVILAVPTGSVPDAPYMMESSQNQLSLANISVLGTNNEKLHITTIR